MTTRSNSEATAKSDDDDDLLDEVFDSSLQDLQEG